VPAEITTWNASYSFLADLISAIGFPFGGIAGRYRSSEFSTESRNGGSCVSVVQDIDKHKIKILASFTGIVDFMRVQV
jgi:hypothetical protein